MLSSVHGLSSAPLKCARRSVVSVAKPTRVAHKVRANPDDAPEPVTPDSPKFVKQIFKNLQDFGIGRSAFTEGGSGLFMAAGAAGAIVLLAWARGVATRTTQAYNITVSLPLACGVTLGTPVRIRGVQVGQVQHVKAGLERVDVMVELNDITTVVPRNSVVEANQSGLIAEPLLDITPQLPLPDWHFSPVDTQCEREGLIVCENGKISGDPGVSLDDLVYLMTRMARKAEGDVSDDQACSCGARTTHDTACSI
eukprot:gene11247-18872_t